MTNQDTDFDNWFDLLQMNLADRGITFTDRDSVRGDYEAGRDIFDVVDLVAAEYTA